MASMQENSNLPAWQAELFVPDAGVLTECPRWDDRAGRLLWVDIYGGTISSCDAAGENRQSMSVGQPIGSFAPRASGGYVLALESGFALSGANASTWTPVGEQRQHPSRLRSNDGACDARGRFFAGTMDHDEEPHAGAVFRLDPAGSDGAAPDPIRVIEGSSVSNGIGWSPDGTRLYYADSAELRVDVFDYDLGTGELSGRRPLVSYAASDGYPDGLTVDAEGCIWVAFWDGGVVRRLAPDGTLVGLVRVPVDRVSSCTFGGPDLTDLFITTARYQMTAEQLAEQPASGSIFRCRPGPVGRPVDRYAG
jgi:sugar lactone lactonase YvrE